jgi:hypothetical protein
MDSYRYTKEGLPVITEETRTAFVKQLEQEVKMRECPSLIMREWNHEIYEENPEIIKYIAHIIDKYPPDLKGVTIASILSLYMLLKSQALNDKIKEYFGVKE